MVLFDADGVLQRPANDARSELAAVLADAGDADLVAFLEEIQAAEFPALDGSADFVDTLAPVLARRGVATSADELLHVWQHVVVDPEMVAAVEKLNAAGLVCALATNQHRQRARVMQATLGYERIFAQRFYSCDIGLAKPDPAYFHYAISRLEVDPASVLFVDDVPANVAAARSVGLHSEVFTRDAGRPELTRILAGFDLADQIAA